MPDKSATDLYKDAVQASQDYSAKVMEFASANTNAGFELMRKLQGAKSPTEAAELTSNHVREQQEKMAEQAKQLQEMAQKAMPKAGD